MYTVTFKNGDQITRSGKVTDITTIDGEVIIEGWSAKELLSAPIALDSFDKENVQRIDSTYSVSGGFLGLGSRQVTENVYYTST